MKIVRDGAEIELTSAELYAAYLEQQHIFDVKDVSVELESVADALNSISGDSEAGCAAGKLLRNPKALDEIADAKRVRMTKYGTPWLTATSDAVYEAIDKMLNN